MKFYKLFSSKLEIDRIKKSFKDENIEKLADEIRHIRVSLFLLVLVHLSISSYHQLLFLHVSIITL